MPPTDRERPPTEPPTEGGQASETRTEPAAKSPPPHAEPPLLDEDGSLPDAVRQRVEAWVPELVKKAFAAGMGAVFTTEDGIRRLTKEMPMPKEVAGYLVSTAGHTKDEFFRIVAGEVRAFLETVNLSEEIAKMLTTLSFEVKTEIRFIPNDEKYAGVEPDVKAKVRLKRAEERRKRRVFRRRGRSDEGGESSGE